MCDWPAGACGRVGSLNGPLARAAIQTVTQASEASAKSFIVRSHSDPKRYWPLSMINERALKLSPNPRVTNSSRALAGLRRRGLVKGHYGQYRLTTAGVKMMASLPPQLPLSDSEKPVDSFCTVGR